MIDPMDDVVAYSNACAAAYAEPLTVEKLIAAVDEMDAKIIATMDPELVASVRRWYPEAKLKHFQLMERIVTESKLPRQIPPYRMPMRTPSFYLGAGF